MPFVPFWSYFSSSLAFRNSSLQFLYIFLALRRSFPWRVRRSGGVGGLYPAHMRLTSPSPTQSLPSNLSASITLSWPFPLEPITDELTAWIESFLSSQWCHSCLRAWMQNTRLHQPFTISQNLCVFVHVCLCVCIWLMPAEFGIPALLKEALSAMKDAVFGLNSARTFCACSRFKPALQFSQDVCSVWMCVCMHALVCMWEAPPFCSRVIDYSWILNWGCWLQVCMWEKKTSLQKTLISISSCSSQVR